VAKVGVAQAQAEAEQRQFELDQRFQNDARYVRNLAGGNFQGYGAGRAMIGMGEGMARGGQDGGVAGLGAQMGVGMAVAGFMHSGGGQAQPAAPRGAGKIVCGKCSAEVPSGKFCQECGSPLAVAGGQRFCASCGNELGAAKFCPSCGAQVLRP
jgi:hypothetical protein